MFIIAMGFALLLVISLIVCWRKDWGSYSCGITAFISGLMLLILCLAGGVTAAEAYYSVYPEMEAFYDSNLGNYQVIVERQNEVATLNLQPTGDGEIFDGSDFSQSKETSNRYQEYRDAANEYNLELAKYRRRGGTFLFWPMPQPDSRLKPIEIK